MYVASSTYEDSRVEWLIRLSWALDHRLCIIALLLSLSDHVLLLMAQFPLLQNGSNNSSTYFIGFLWRLNELISINSLEQRLM